MKQGETEEDTPFDELDVISQAGMVDGVFRRALYVKRWHTLEGLPRPGAEG